jgi:hypothetical protein
MRQVREPQALLAALLIAATYAIALRGPFVLDDHVNLAPVWQWWSGQAGFGALFATPSGPLGRPLALLSFALDARLGGTSPFGFKLVNLLLHLVNAALVWRVLRHLVGTDGRNATDAAPPAAALALAALWALHPQHVSTVMYVVQRMTLLGAMAQLGAVLLYLQARERLPHDPRGARWRLFVAFPAALALGLLGKETAALAPLLCGALELTRFAGSTRPRELRVFLGAFVALPLVVAVVLLALQRARVLGGYDGREFDLAQRLLSEPRILFDYAAGWFWPAPGHLALYRDGYPLSTGWMQPASTAIAIAAWMLLAAVAFALRRRVPLFAAGIAWFFAAHALESTLLPLEPYFEHRNYVASLGLLLAGFALLRLLPAAAATPRALAYALLAALTLATALRCWNWSDPDRLLATQGPPPGEISRRLQVDRAIRAVELGDPVARDAALARLADGNAGDAAAAALWRAIFACDGDGRVPADLIDAIAAHPAPVLTHNHLSWLSLLVRRSAIARCEGLERDAMRRVLDRWQAAARAPLSRHALVQLAAMRDQLGRAPP